MTGRRRRVHRRVWRATALVTAALIGPAAVPALSATERSLSSHHRVLEQDCDVLAPVIDAEAARVDPLVPDEFEVKSDQRGMAVVQVGAVRCRSVYIDGVDIGLTRWVFFRVDLAENPSGDPDGASEFNSYEFFLASDNLQFVKFFREEGADPTRMVYVKSLVYDDSVPGKVTVEAKAPTPSPFKIEGADAAPRTPFPVPLIGQIWGTGRDGWWQRGPNDVIEGIKFGPAVGTLTMSDPESVMGRVFCGNPDFADPGGHASFEASFYSVHQQLGASTSPTAEPPPCPD